MNSKVIYIPCRGVRSLNPYFFRPPWPFVKKGSYGHRKIGPIFYEKWKYPGQDREFPDISPKFQKLNFPATQGYTRVQPEGYTDPITKQYVVVKEMQAEIIVPDLSDFKLKPYVSYRTDADIEKRRRVYDDAVIETGSEEAADLKVAEGERWPPPKITPETLFDLFYAPQVREMYKEGRYDVPDDSKDGSPNSSQEKKTVS